MKLTLSGSIGFYKEMKAARDALVMQNHEVQIPELILDAPTDRDRKGDALRTHYKKIDWCEAILVINNERRGIQGYIGGSTLIEIGVAFYLKKKIYILNPISSEISYIEEIMAMKPIMLDGDLSKI